jgi:hypothetical protein
MIRIKHERAAQYTSYNRMGVSLDFTVDMLPLVGPVKTTPQQFRAAFNFAFDDAVHTANNANMIQRQQSTGMHLCYVYSTSVKRLNCASDL